MTKGPDSQPAAIETSTHSTQRAVTTVASVVISLAVVVYLANKLDWEATRVTFAHLGWGYLVAAWLTFGLNYVLRTLRFRALLSEKVPVLKLFPIASLHGMFNYVMPAKSGELSFPLLLNRHLRVSLTRSAATLIVARVLDFAVISLSLPIMLAAFWRRLPASIVYASLAFSALVYSLEGAILWRLRRSRAHSASMGLRKLSPADWVDGLFTAWDGLVEELRSVDRRGQYARLTLLTVGIWLCVYSNLYLILLSLGHQLEYFHVVVISLVTVPMSLLPVRGFANLGTHEVSWVAALMLFGQTEDAALTMAVSSHILLLVFELLLGLGGLMMLVRNVPWTNLFTGGMRQTDR